MKSIFRKTLAILMVLSFVFFGFSFVKVNATTGSDVITATIDGKTKPIASNNDLFEATFNGGAWTWSSPQLRASAGNITIKAISKSIASIDKVELAFSSGSYASTGIVDSNKWTASLNNATTTIEKIQGTANKELVWEIDKSIRFKTATIYYTLSSEPSVDISVESTDLMIGMEDIHFETSIMNLESPTNPVYNIGNPDVISIVEGKIHPISVGVSTFSISINEIVSNELQLIVFPNNEGVISIEEAISIATFTGETNTPFKYECFGTVKSVTGLNDFILTDGKNDITVYQYGHNLKDGSKVNIVGELVNYNMDTIEFTKCEIQTAYSVVFVENGGNEVSDINYVKSGAKITSPTSIKDGYTFQGWFKDTLLTQEFDFDEDIITADTTLYAKFAKEIDASIVNALNNTKSYMSLSYSFEGSPSGIVYSLVKNTDELISGQTYALGYYDIKTEKYIYNGAFGKNVYMSSVSELDKIYDLTLGGEEGAWTFTSSDGLIGCDDAKKMNASGNGTTTWSISFTGDNVIISSTTPSYGTIYYNSGSPRFLNYTSKQGSIVLFKKVTNYEFKESHFVLRCGIDKGFSETASLLDNAKYGIEVSCGTTIKKYASTNEFYTVEGDYEYVIIDIGDCLNNIERMSKEFTVKAYLELNGEYYYSISEKTYSVNGLLTVYHNIVDDYDEDGLSSSDKVASLYNVLSKMGQVK